MILEGSSSYATQQAWEDILQHEMVTNLHQIPVCGSKLFLTNPYLQLLSWWLNPAKGINCQSRPTLAPSFELQSHPSSERLIGVSPQFRRSFMLGFLMDHQMMDMFKREAAKNKHTQHPIKMNDDCHDHTSSSLMEYSFQKYVILCDLWTCSSNNFMQSV